jgi:hypothetical protein
MTTHREADPEGDSADDRFEDPLGTRCTSCGGSLDTDGDCEDPQCPQSPYHLDEDDADTDEEPELNA